MKIKMKLDPNNAGQMNAARAFFEILAGVTPLKVEGENIDTTTEKEVYSIPVDPVQVADMVEGDGEESPKGIVTSAVDATELERRAKLAKRREKAAAAKKAKEEAEEAAAEQKEAEIQEEAAQAEAVEEEAPTYTLEDVRALITKKVAEGHKDAMFAKIRTMDRRDDVKKYSVPNLAPEEYGAFMKFMEGLK